MIPITPTPCPQINSATCSLRFEAVNTYELAQVFRNTTPYNLCNLYQTSDGDDNTFVASFDNLDRSLGWYNQSFHVFQVDSEGEVHFEPAPRLDAAKYAQDVYFDTTPTAGFLPSAWGFQTNNRVALGPDNLVYVASSGFDNGSTHGIVYVMKYMNNAVERLLSFAPNDTSPINVFGGSIASCGDIVAVTTKVEVTDTSDYLIYFSQYPVYTYIFQLVHDGTESKYVVQQRAKLRQRTEWTMLVQTAVAMYDR